MLSPPKNETRVILNILYSYKSVEMKFYVRYPDGELRLLWMISSTTVEIFLCRFILEL